MLDLSAPKAPFDIALSYGLSVTVKPLTTAGMAAAQAAARRRVEAIERQARERTEAGLLLDGLPDLWAEGETLPWPFTEDAVEEAGEATLTLRPDGTT